MKKLLKCLEIGWAICMYIAFFGLIAVFIWFSVNDEKPKDPDYYWEFIEENECQRYLNTDFYDCKDGRWEFSYWNNWEFISR